jgi:hypothetical protein
MSKDFNTEFENFHDRAKADPEFNRWQISLSVFIMHWVNAVPLAFLIGYIIGHGGQVEFVTWLITAIFAAGQVLWIWTGFRNMLKMHELLAGQSAQDTVR